MKENAGNTGKATIAIRHPAQQHITRSYSSKQHLKKKCCVRDARCPYCILHVQIATKQIVEQQSIELIVQSPGDHGGAANSAEASSSSSIAYRYVSYENYAGTRPPWRRQTNVNYETVLVQLPK